MYNCWRITSPINFYRDHYSPALNWALQAVSDTRNFVTCSCMLWIPNCWPKDEMVGSHVCLRAKEQGMGGCLGIGGQRHWGGWWDLSSPFLPPSAVPCLCPWLIETVHKMDPSNSKTLLYSAQSWLFLRVMSAACIFLILILIPIDRQIISRGSVCHCSCSTNNPRGMHRWSGEVSSSLVPRLKMHWVPKHLFLASTLLATQSLHRLRCRCELSWVFCLLAWLLNRNSSNQCHVNLLFVSMSPLNLLPLSIHFTHMSTFNLFSSRHWNVVTMTYQEMLFQLLFMESKWAITRSWIWLICCIVGCFSDTLHNLHICLAKMLKLVNNYGPASKLAVGYNCRSMPTM